VILFFARGIDTATPHPDMNSTHKHHLKRIVEDVAKDVEILALFLYGSSARKEACIQSYVDLCLVLMPASYTPNELSQKKLTYLKSFELDIQIFQQLPIYIKKRVIKEGKVLYCKDEDALYDLCFAVIREFSDFEHIYRHYLTEVADGR
jgi:predicted nucleotidyltransferase